MFSILFPTHWAASCSRAARRLLAPVGLAYWCVTWVRNRAFDRGWLASRSFGVPVVCVGNITVGGTGKTPLIEHLLSVLTHGCKVGVVSRGYRRKSKGQVVADARSSSAADIGDEPRQMLSKFPQTLMVVDSDRVSAIDKAIALGARVVLMDDGMQHRAAHPSHTIMVCDYARPPYDDLPLPAGNLREPWAERHRANVVVVNKCPAGLTQQEADVIRAKMELRPGQELFFSAIGYAQDFVPIADAAPSVDPHDAATGAAPYADARGGAPTALTPQTPVVALAGIGRPEPFFQELSRRFRRVTTVAFADHHSFSDADIEYIGRLVADAGPGAVIVCTEKDAVRLPKGFARQMQTQVYALPIRLQFLFNQEDTFNKIIFSYAH